MLDNKKNGLGVFLKKNLLLEGIWENNVLREGVSKNVSGLYKGTFLEGKRSGKGEFFWGNGEYY